MTRWIDADVLRAWMDECKGDKATDFFGWNELMQKIAELEVQADELYMELVNRTTLHGLEAQEEDQCHKVGIEN